MHHTNRVPGLSYGIGCGILRLAAGRTPTWDEQTDGQTHVVSIYRAIIASRSRNKAIVDIRLRPRCAIAPL